MNFDNSHQIDYFKTKSFIPIVSSARNQGNFESTAIFNEVKEKKFEAMMKEPYHLYVYINEQIKLYSDLASGRNYNWKAIIEKEIPIPFVINCINDKTYLKETRSAFCKLIQNVLIDQEPRARVKYPFKCKVFGDNIEISKFSASEMEKGYLKLLQGNSLAYIKKSVEKIKTIYNEFLKSNEKDKTILIPKNFLANSLLLENINIIYNLVEYDSFGSFSLSNQEASIFISSAVSLLEFFSTNTKYSYLVDKTRNLNYQKARSIELNKKNLVISGVKGIKSLMGSVFENVTDLTMEVAGTFLNSNIGGNRAKKIKTKDEKTSVRFNDTVFYSHPILRTYLEQKDILENCVEGFDAGVMRVEREIKVKICELLIFLIRMRRNFLIDNVIAWFENFSKNFVSFSKLSTMISEQITTVLPPIMKTGIVLLDEIYTIKDSNEIMGNMKKIIGEKGTSNKKFKIYSKLEEIPDLDLLLTSEFQNSSNIKKEILPSLITSLILSKDPFLDNKLLEVIMKCFHQREALIKSLADLELLFTVDDKAIFTESIGMTRQLRSLMESYEIWMNELEMPENIYSKLSDINMNLKKFLSFFSQREKVKRTFQRSSEKIEKEKIPTVLDSERLYLLPDSEITENEIPKIMSLQKILSFFKIPKLLVNYLEDTYYSFLEILENDEDSEILHLNVQIYKSIFEILSKFCENNFANQIFLYKYFDKLFFTMNYDFGQALLIKNIFLNNAYLCESLSDKNLKKIIMLLQKIARKKCFIEILIVKKILNKALMFCEGRYIMENQERVIRFLIPSINTNDIGINLYATNNNGLKENFEFTFDNQSFAKKDLTGLFQKDEPYVYHKSLLECLMMSVQGKEGNNLNNAKIRKTLNLSTLFDLLTQKDVMQGHFGSSNFENYHRQEYYEGLTFLKPTILKFIIEIYLKSDSKGKIEFEILEDVINSFMAYEMKRFQDENQFFLENNEHNHRYIKYFFGKFLVFCKFYYQTYIDKRSEMEGDDYNTIQGLSKSITSSLVNFQDTLTVKQKVKLKEFYKTIYSDIDEAIVELIDGCEDKNIELHSVNDNKPEMEIPDNKVNWKSSDGWKSFIEEVFKTQNLQTEVNNEQKALAEAIMKLEHMFPEEEKKKLGVKVDTVTFIKKIIKFLQNSLINKAYDATIIYCLELLGNIIEISDKKVDTQNFLDKNDATLMILGIFADHKIRPLSDDLFSSFLALLIKLLEGGNSYVQSTIYHYFTMNPNSELVFELFYNFLKHQIDFLQLMQITPNKSDSNKNTLKSQILEKLLRTLQLITEGHNLELQTYLRTQSNSRNSYDMVMIIIELLNVYNSNISSENFENIVQCLDTLTELVQGPCPENQNALIDGKFFDVAYTILTFQNAKTKINRKQSYSYDSIPISSKTMKSFLMLSRKSSFNDVVIEEWMLERLRYKCMILVNSLLEMKESNKVTKKIIRSLPPEILKKNLLRSHKNFLEIYSNKYDISAFNHFENDPECSNYSIDYYENILECGFLTFFLLSEYSEIIEDPDLSRNQTNLEIASTSEKKKTKRGIIYSSVIVQIGFLIVSLVKTTSELIRNFITEIRLKILLRSTKMDIRQKDYLKAQLQKKEIRDAMQFFSENSAHIEIIRNNKIEKVYFIILPYCHFLPKEFKISFHDAVDRVSVKTKVNSLVSQTKSIIQICQHEERLAAIFEKSSILRLFGNYVNLWKDTAYLTTLLLNIFIFFSYKEDESLLENSSDRTDSRINSPKLFFLPFYSSEKTRNLFWDVGLVQFISSIFVMLFFLFKKAPVYFKRAWQYDLIDDPSIQIIIKAKRSLLSRIFFFFKRCLIVGFLFLKNIDLCYYLAYGTFSILGLVIHPFFFSFHLTEILIRYPTLTNVVKSVWEPRYAIFLTLVLFTIVEYLFSLIGFQFFNKDYNGKCESVLFCFLYTIDMTFKFDGGIGGFLTSEDKAQPFNAGRLLFDNFFNLIVVIIMINILAALIIDTFSLLRDKENERNRDINEVCFICGHTRDIFDRKAEQSKGFIHHIKQDHYMWNYIFYLAYLQYKDETEFTGNETYVYEKFKQNDISFFPFKRALSLKEGQEEEEAKRRDELTSHNGTIEKMTSEIEKMKGNLNYLSENLRTRNIRMSQE